MDIGHYQDTHKYGQHTHDFITQSSAARRTQVFIEKSDTAEVLKQPLTFEGDQDSRSDNEDAKDNAHKKEIIFNRVIISDGAWTGQVFKKWPTAPGRGCGVSASTSFFVSAAWVLIGHFLDDRVDMDDVAYTDVAVQDHAHALRPELWVDRHVLWRASFPAFYFAPDLAGDQLARMFSVLEEVRTDDTVLAQVRSCAAWASFDGLIRRHVNPSFSFCTLVPPGNHVNEKTFPLC